MGIIIKNEKRQENDLALLVDSRTDCRISFDCGTDCMPCMLFYDLLFPEKNAEDQGSIPHAQRKGL